MLDFPATHRNFEVIAQELENAWDPAVATRFLEVASGSGQHVVGFAQRFPTWEFQPTDLEPLHLKSINAYRHELKVANCLAPLLLDVTMGPWPSGDPWDAILAINLIHISPWESTVALFRDGKRCLNQGGRLLLYGAFREGGQHTAPSNEAFDRSLRQQDPSWGVRCLDQVKAVAQEHEWAHLRTVTMPANNLCVHFTRVS